MREDQIIKRIQKAVAGRTGTAHRDLILGIGDDAAVLRSRAGADWVFSSDFSLEGLHFLAGTPPRAIGYRSLARAVSDLAAMGARPEFFLLSISVPAQRAGVWLDRVVDGMALASRQYGMRLIGGDTTCWPKVAIAVTVIGRIAPGRAMRRDGARVGDQVFVSGQLGAAALGLAVLLARRRLRSPRGSLRGRCLLRPHLYPAVPVDLGMYLAERGLASAAIDLSDGLSTDLARLADASRVGARVIADRLPAVSVPADPSLKGLRPLDLALHGGEDYGLLFTVSAERAGEIPGRFHGIPITCIGQIVKGRGVRIAGGNGHWRRLVAGGWDPFREKRGMGQRGQALSSRSSNRRHL